MWMEKPSFKHVLDSSSCSIFLGSGIQIIRSYAFTQVQFCCSFCQIKSKSIVFYISIVQFKTGEDNKAILEDNLKQEKDFPVKPHMCYLFT
jgi:hypothetical protein